jgi:hypothetical protein
MFKWHKITFLALTKQKCLLRALMPKTFQNPFSIDANIREKKMADVSRFGLVGYTLCHNIYPT